MTREEAIDILMSANVWNDEERMAWEFLIPELSESEDERIRKWLIDYFKEVGKSWIHRDISPEQILAYLEKQKEPENTSASTMAPSCWAEEPSLQKEPKLATDSKSERVIKAARSVLNNWLDGTDCPDVSGDFAELEYAIREYDGDDKQKEQKYIGLSKADKLFLQDVADVLGDNEYKDAAKRLRDLSESLYLQPKAEWNEEEEKMLKWIEDILLIADGDLSDKLNGKVSPITDSAYSSMKLCIAKCLSWLKSLRPRLSDEEIKKIRSEEYTKGFNDAAFGGKLKEWSMEDEDRIRQIERIAQQAGCTQKLQEEIHDWLKSLRPSWKPSEEQMDALRITLDYIPDTFKPRCTLMTLQNDLKKQM